MILKNMGWQPTNDPTYSVTDMTYTISREIGIDAGHRVPTHGSKCRHLHGHRYHIQAVCKAGLLQESGEQKDMVLDFGFLKEEMMKAIDEPCDHGLILYECDALVPLLIPDAGNRIKAAEFVLRDGHCNVPQEWTDEGAGKIYLIPEIPTAEVLAKHWYYRLKERVFKRSSRHARLSAVKVWETPNCWAVYREQSRWPAHETIPEGR